VPVANQGEGLGKEALADLHGTRQEVVNKVNAAQERRVDNMISRLDDSTRVLQMYSWVCTAVRRQVSRVWWQVHLKALLCSASLAGIAGGVYFSRGALVERFGERWQFMHLPILFGGQTLGAIYYGMSYPKIAQRSKELATDENLTRLFEDNYRMEIAEVCTLCTLSLSVPLSFSLCPSLPLSRAHTFLLSPTLSDSRSLSRARSVSTHTTSYFICGRA